MFLAAQKLTQLKWTPPRISSGSISKESEFFEEAMALGDMIKNKMAQVLSGVNALGTSRGGTQGNAMPQSEDQDMQARIHVPTLPYLNFPIWLEKMPAYFSV
jgi:hypothetical protein